ncbi:MAG: sugar transferase [Bacteroidota bacterium]
MLKEKEQIINNLIGVVEVIFTYFSFFIALYFIEGKIVITEDYSILLLFLGPLWFFLLKFYNISRIYRVNPYSYILFAYFILVAIGVGLLFLLIVIFDLDSVRKSVLVVFSGVNLVSLYLLKIDIYYVFKKYRRKGKNTVNVMLVGDEDLEGLIQKIEKNTFWGYNIIGVVTDNRDVIDNYASVYPILPPTLNISEYIEEHTVDEVLFSEGHFDKNIIRLIYSCLEIGVVFRMSSQFLNIAQAKSSIQYLDEIPFFTFQNTPNNYIYLSFKAVFDFFFSLIVLLFLSPIFLIIALLIKIDSPKGPVIFKQTRVGLRGRKFQLYKFRSMIPNAEKVLQTEEEQKESIVNEQDGPVFKMKNDPRVTRVGKFLRKTSLDELPQFFNVIKGDMAIVGPRPPIPSEVEKYERWQLRRLSMKPGITCIWQVSGRNNIPFERWMKLDLQYIDTWSLKLDFMIILKTIKTILKRDGL